ncbi:GNAT family N-acetyltransferase [Alteromonas sp. S015]|uniref:GNAT family N-acetyltransferase n=1 Tax=Alteromonas sp. S015 TaxID=3117401 RepID=UPI002FE34DF6
MTWNAAYLNQAGISSCDQSWIEYNDVFCKDGWEDACVEALMNFIETSTFTEFHISLAKKPNSWLNAVSEHWYIETDKHFAAKVNLDVSNATSHYSKNTKYQINRAIKSVTSRYGSMNVHRAISIEEKRKYFLLLADFHIAKWKDSEYGSGFQNPIFTRHLNKLIEQFPEQVDLVSVSAGNTLLGVSFNLIAGDKIGFYCSGINYAIADKKIKPGYLLHHTLIEYYAQEGKTEYDFLAGYSQYKKSMSSDTYSLTSINFTRKSLKGIFIHWLRRSKLRLRAYASKLPIPQ